MSRVSTGAVASCPTIVSIRTTRTTTRPPTRPRIIFSTGGPDPTANSRRRPLFTGGSDTPLSSPRHEETQPPPPSPSPPAGDAPTDGNCSVPGNNSTHLQHSSSGHTTDLGAMSKSVDTQQQQTHCGTERDVDETPCETVCNVAAGGSTTDVRPVVIQSNTPTVLIVPADNTDAKMNSPGRAHERSPSASSSSDSYDLVSFVSSKDPSSLDIICIRTRFADDTQKHHSSSSYEDLSGIAVRQWSPYEASDFDDELSDVPPRDEFISTSATVTVSSSSDTSVAEDGQQRIPEHEEHSPSRQIPDNTGLVMSNDDDLYSIHAKHLPSSSDIEEMLQSNNGFAATDPPSLPVVHRRDEDDSTGLIEIPSDVAYAKSAGPSKQTSEGVDAKATGPIKTTSDAVVLDDVGTVHSISITVNKSSSSVQSNAENDTPVVAPLSSNAISKVVIDTPDLAQSSSNVTSKVVRDTPTVAQSSPCQSTKVVQDTPVVTQSTSNVTSKDVRDTLAVVQSSSNVTSKVVKDRPAVSQSPTTVTSKVEKDIPTVAQSPKTVTSKVVKDTSTVAQSPSSDKSKFEKDTLSVVQSSSNVTPKVVKDKPAVAQSSSNVTPNVVKDKPAVAQSSSNVTPKVVKDKPAVAQSSSNVTPNVVKDKPAVAQSSSNVTPKVVKDKPAAAQSSSNVTPKVVKDKPAVAQSSSNVTPKVVKDKPAVAQSSSNVTPKVVKDKPAVAQSSLNVTSNVKKDTAAVAQSPLCVTPKGEKDTIAVAQSSSNVTSKVEKGTPVAQSSSNNAPNAPSSDITQKYAKDTPTVAQSTSCVTSKLEEGNQIDRATSRAPLNDDNGISPSNDRLSERQVHSQGYCDLMCTVHIAPSEAVEVVYTVKYADVKQSPVAITPTRHGGVCPISEATVAPKPNLTTARTTCTSTTVETESTQSTIRTAEQSSIVRSHKDIQKEVPKGSGLNIKQMKPVETGRCEPPGQRRASKGEGIKRCVSVSANSRTHTLAKTPQRPSDAKREDGSTEQYMQRQPVSVVPVGEATTITARKMKVSNETCNTGSTSPQRPQHLNLNLSRTMPHPVQGTNKANLTGSNGKCANRAKQPLEEARPHTAKSSLMSVAASSPVTAPALSGPAPTFPFRSPPPGAVDTDHSVAAPLSLPRLLPSPGSAGGSFPGASDDGLYRAPRSPLLAYSPMYPRKRITMGTRSLTDLHGKEAAAAAALSGCPGGRPHGLGSRSSSTSSTSSSVSVGESRSKHHIGIRTTPTGREPHRYIPVQYMPGGSVGVPTTAERRWQFFAPPPPLPVAAVSPLPAHCHNDDETPSAGSTPVVTPLGSTASMASFGRVEHAPSWSSLYGPYPPERYNPANTTTPIRPSGVSMQQLRTQFLARTPPPALSPPKTSTPGPVGRAVQRIMRGAAKIPEEPISRRSNKETTVQSPNRGSASGWAAQSCSKDGTLSSMKSDTSDTFEDAREFVTPVKPQDGARSRAGTHFRQEKIAEPKKTGKAGKNKDGGKCAIM